MNNVSDDVDDHTELVLTFVFGTVRHTAA